MRPLSQYVGPRTQRVLKSLGRVPYAHEIYRESRIFARSAWKLFPRLLSQASGGYEPRVGQQLITWDVACDGVSSTDDLRRSLTARHIQFQEGIHSIYLPPQPNLSAILGPASEFYPSEAGFKIIKRPAQHRDSAGQSAQEGTDAQEFNAALVLNALKLGPRVYDFTELRAPGVTLPCLVVQHVEGTAVCGSEATQFQIKAKSVLRNHGIEMAMWPNGNGAGNGRNGRESAKARVVERAADGLPVYLGSGQCGVTDRQKVLDSLLISGQDRFHFGRTRLHRRERYLYQSVPGVRGGKRDMRDRWLQFARMLDTAGIGLAGRPVLDICCNAGMMLALSLHQGSSWALGWDLPEVAAAAEQVQLLLGNTRLQCFGARLSQDYRLSKDVPVHIRKALNGSAVFFLAAWRYVGFLEDLANIPWTVLVFEGHEKDTADDTRRNYAVMQSRWNCKLFASERMSDGDCGERDIALFVRQ